MQLKRVLAAMRELAPEHLAEPWDHVGLQVGGPSWPVERALLCIDLTPRVLREAIARRASLIVAYHPPIFDPLPALTEEVPKQRLISAAAQRRIAIYSPHTALDAAAGGVNDWLCEAALPGILRAVSPGARKGATARGGQIRAIRPSGASGDSRPFKLVTYVPPKSLERLFTALCAAGAGQIGNYSECSFSQEGMGTFRGAEGTHPTLGAPGRLEHVVEHRLETIVPAARVAEVVAALMKAHPYEEPAFDLFRLDLPPSSGGEGVGQGRVVTLEKPLALGVLIARLKKMLGLRKLEVALPQTEAPRTPRLARLGFCAGAGGSLLKDAGPLDAFITGEMRHHDVLAAAERGTVVILGGHTQTERPYLRVYGRRLAAAVGPSVEWMLSRADRPPTRVM